MALWSVFRLTMWDGMGVGGVGVARIHTEVGNKNKKNSCAVHMERLPVLVHGLGGGAGARGELPHVEAASEAPRAWFLARGFRAQELPHGGRPPPPGGGGSRPLLWSHLGRGSQVVHTNVTQL